MVRKASLKKINDIIRWILIIAMICMGIYYIFNSKDILNGMSYVIIWGCIGTANASCIIDSKYFEENFSWKNNWVNIIAVFISIMIFAKVIL
jgi:hypothetical protein